MRVDHVCVCIHMYMYACLYISVYIYTCIYIYICPIYKLIHTDMCVCVFMHLAKAAGNRAPYVKAHPVANCPALPDVPARKGNQKNLRGAASPHAHTQHFLATRHRKTKLSSPAWEQNGECDFRSTASSARFHLQNTALPKPHKICWLVTS